MQNLRPGTRVHIVGIGGIGLSAIARVLHGWGFVVTGSDRARSALTDSLQTEGIPVRIGHRPDNLATLPGGAGSGDSLVVVSSAIPDGNLEVAAAKDRGLFVLRRREFLGLLTRDKVTIAIAGTHGKTTTTAMVAWILVEAGFDPSFVVGGVLQNLGTNARAGSGDHLVIEADEYDRAFLGLRPQVAVVTSLEHDHPDCYPTFGAMKDAFAEFAARTSEGGRLIVCGDDAAAVSVAERAVSGASRSTSLQPAQAGAVPTASFDTFGMAVGCSWQAEDLQLNGCPVFRVRSEGRRMGTCAIQLPGRHNVLNALAALAATAAVGVDFDTAAAALTRFRGTARRFEVKGQVGGVTVVDDYAHHPTEIRATLAAARSKYPGRPLWVVFQPHTFSRTSALLQGFAQAFGDADHVVVTGIYAAREQGTGQVSGADIVDRMQSDGVSRPSSHYVELLEEAAAWLLDRVGPGAVVITMGAGDGYLVGEQVLERLQRAGDALLHSPESGTRDQVGGSEEYLRRWLG